MTEQLWRRCWRFCYFMEWHWDWLGGQLFRLRCQLLDALEEIDG